MILVLFSCTPENTVMHSETSFSHTFCFERNSHEMNTNISLTTLVLLLRWVYWRYGCRCGRWGHMVVRVCFSVCVPLSSWLTWLMLVTCTAVATALKSIHIPHCLILFFPALCFIVGLFTQQTHSHNHTGKKVCWGVFGGGFALRGSRSQTWTWWIYWACKLYPEKITVCLMVICLTMCSMSLYIQV